MNVEFLRGDPEAARAGGDYHRRVTRLQPGEIARLVDALPYLHAAELLTIIPDPLAADTLEVMTPERQLQVFEEFDEDQGRRVLALMAPNVAADLVGRLQPQRARRYLEQLPDTPRTRLVELLRYPEDTAGGIMTNDVLVVPAALTVAEARQILREPLKDPDFIYYIYAVDDADSRRLRGVLTLRNLLLGKETCRVAEMMQVHLVTANPLEPALAAARRLADHHLAGCRWSAATDGCSAP